MRTLIYKRTHPDDPDETGQFGLYDCMGRVRTWKFEAVIGVGGQGAEPREHELDGKVNWIGIGPRKGRWHRRGPIITFDHFYLRGANGPDFEKLAPVLAQRIYSRNVRVVMHGLSAEEQKEVDKILALAKRAPASPARRSSRKRATGC